jgi:hypothetical protein
MRQAQDNLETWQDVFEPDEQRHRWRRITNRERNLKNLKKYKMLFQNQTNRDTDGGELQTEREKKIKKSKKI